MYLCTVWTYCLICHCAMLLHTYWIRLLWYVLYYSHFWVYYGRLLGYPGIVHRIAILSPLPVLLFYKMSLLLWASKAGFLIIAFKNWFDLSRYTFHPVQQSPPITHHPSEDLGQCCCATSLNSKAGLGGGEGAGSRVTLSASLWASALICSWVSVLTELLLNTPKSTSIPLTPWRVFLNVLGSNLTPPSPLCPHRAWHSF